MLEFNEGEKKLLAEMGFPTDLGYIMSLGADRVPITETLADELMYRGFDENWDLNEFGYYCHGALNLIGYASQHPEELFSD